MSRAKNEIIPEIGDWVMIEDNFSQNILHKVVDVNECGEVKLIDRYEGYKWIPTKDILGVYSIRKRQCNVELKLINEIKNEIKMRKMGQGNYLWLCYDTQKYIIENGNLSYSSFDSCLRRGEGNVKVVEIMNKVYTILKYHIKDYYDITMGYPFQKDSLAYKQILDIILKDLKENKQC